VLEWVQDTDVAVLQITSTLQAVVIGFALSLSSSALGRAVQVDPMRTKVTPSGTKHLKQKCVILLSTFAFKFNLRRFTWACSSCPTVPSSTPAW
jgi:hypothetical protein